MRGGWVIELEARGTGSREWFLRVDDPSGRKFGFYAKSDVAKMVLNDPECPRNFGVEGHMRLPREVIDRAREILQVYDTMHS